MCIYILYLTLTHHLIRKRNLFPADSICERGTDPLAGNHFTAYRAGATHIVEATPKNKKRPLDDCNIVTG